ncbi:MAG: ASCH domain-containing protein [Methyloprofundus sp.]|nr:ASCH domain-containing protein [Methyloprofundus sp.]MDT8424868.1 ASCH domain-containing protein [Methyloprofundus sp.]
MTDLPERTCSIDRLITHPKLVEAALSGRKTQQRRDGVYAYPNETFTLEGQAFIVTDLTRETIGDMTDAEAQAEGYPSLVMYRDLILRMHAGMEWDESALVWVHHFKRVD